VSLIVVEKAAAAIAHRTVILIDVATPRESIGSVRVATPRESSASDTGDNILDAGEKTGVQVGGNSTK
jgi:hypothetical protein